MKDDALRKRLTESEEKVKLYRTELEDLCKKRNVPLEDALNGKTNVRELLLTIYCYERANTAYENQKRSLRLHHNKETVNQVLELYHNTPNGRIADCDTVLKDLMDTVSFEENGLGEEVLKICLNSKDKESVESLFYTFTGLEFENYLQRCIEETTKKTVRDAIEGMKDDYYATLICNSFGEAVHNSRTKNIVIIDDTDIYLTYKKDGVFGELVSWNGDEISEDPDYMMKCITSWVYDVYSRSDKDIHRRIEDGSFPLNFEPYEMEGLTNEKE